MVVLPPVVSSKRERIGKSRLNREEPVVGIRFFSRLNVQETRVKLFRQAAGRSNRNGQFLVAIPDRGNGGDNRGGADAKGFFERASGITGEDFFHGEWPLFKGSVHFAQEGEHGIARDAGE